jgi:LAO/AO transport system kinase
MTMTVEDILSGNRLALARALTAVENENADGREILSALYPRGGKGYLIGVTGSPGAGKSTLVNQIVLDLRGRFPDKKIAILAIDPTSPFSGGAVLGDRVRMRDLSGDPNIFIRSMASRGALGGLAAQTAALAQVFDGAGYDYIFIETVGAGQNEVDIVRVAHTTLVVEAPGMGDDIQAIKAGILEIADLLVINKADHPGVEATERALRTMLELANGSGRNTGHHRVEESAPENAASGQADWKPLILKTVASGRQGIGELVDSMLNHQAWMQTSGQMQLREAARVEAELSALLQALLVRRWQESSQAGRWAETIELVLQRKTSPHDAVERLFSNNTD